MISWQLKRFKDLTVLELYAILQLRAEIFVVEQQAIYLDCDDLDLNAWHIFGLDDKHIFAYARIYRQQLAMHIGRVCVAKNYRGRNFAYNLVTQSIEFIKDYTLMRVIEISAQSYLVDFYYDFGFKCVGAEYLTDDGIMHIDMSLTLSD